MNASHPARETLAAYGLGKLSPADSVAVETHIAECEPCCETLLGLGSDTFVERLRQADGAEGTIGLDEAPIGTVSELSSELTEHPRYRVLELLGKGGMGNVYKAEHTLMNRSVALKVINRELVQNAQAVERFRREVQSAAQLTHPNIVTAHDAEQAGEMHFLVMEYVPGDNLSDVVKRDGPLDISLACDSIRQAAQGLQHAHERGMVHRDVKPHNLMVTSDGLIKILDFGLATLVSETVAAGTADHAMEYATNGTSHAQLTSAGSMMGTPDFIAPEQATDARAADIRSDIYSLGCTFYYLLAGRPPFTEGSALERVKAHGKLEPEPIERLRTDVPPELAEIVRRMMAKDPAERFQTPADVANALAPFIDTPRPMPAPRNVAKPPPSAGSSRRSWWPPAIATALALAACVLSGVIYVATDNGTLVVESEDDDVEIVIRSGDGLKIVDTVTGSTVKRLPSGEYSVNLKGDDNDFELSKGRFQLKRGGRVIVKVSRSLDAEVAGHAKETFGKNRDESTTRVMAETRLWASRRLIGPGTVSSDGLSLAYIDWSSFDLGLRNLQQKSDRVVVQSHGSKGYSDAPPVLSPNGEHIVFNWFEDGWSSYGLRTCGVDGADVNDLYRNDEVRWIKPCDWSPDGTRVLALFSRKDRTQQMALVSVEDRSARVIKSFDWNGPSTMRFSPDGHAIIYDRKVPSAANRPPNHDIFVLNLKENSETALVEHPANDKFLGWTIDGRTVLFSSDRRHSVDAWAVDASGNADPKLVRNGIGRANPIGFTKDESFLYSTTSFPRDVYVATVDADSGTLVDSPKKVSQFREGGNTSPTWSPDGRRLAYIHSRNPARITIYTPEKDEYRELYPDLKYLRGRGALWSPNSQSFILAGTPKKGRSGIYLVDVESGETTLVRAGDEKRVSQPEWTPDGKSILFAEFKPARWLEASVVMWIRDMETGDEKEIPGEWVSTSEPSFALSPDGKTLAFVTHYEANANLKVVSIDGGKPQLLHQEKTGGIGRVAWSPGGSHVIFEKTDKDQPTQLWQVSTTGDDPRPLGLSANGVVGHGFIYPSIHPDGRQIAFSASDDNEQTARSEVWVLENFLPSPTTDEPAAAFATQPNPRQDTAAIQSIEVLHSGSQTISPDLSKSLVRTRMAYRVRDRASGTTVQIMDDFDDGVPGGSPVWSHDSKWIAYGFFMGDYQGPCEIRIGSAEDGTVRTAYQSHDDNLVIQDWAPDGRSILCLARKKDKTSSLVIIPVNGDDIRQLKSFAWDHVGHARFSPDGEHIVFEAGRDSATGNHIRIHVMDVAGTEIIRLTESQVIETHPTWLADGKYVVFTSANQLRTVECQDGKPVSDPVFLRADWNDSEKRRSASGELLFRKYNRFNDVYELDVFDDTWSSLTQVTKLGHAKSPAWSPDGKRIAFINRDVKVLSVADGTIETIKTGLSYHLSVFWSPNGKTLAIGGGMGNEPIGISLYSLETRKLHSLVRFALKSFNSGGFYPRGFSPDGKEFVLHKYVAEDGSTRTNVAYDVKTGTERQIDFPKCPDHLHHFDISRATKRIAYVANEPESSVWKVVVSDVHFQNPTVVETHEEGTSWMFTHPRWSPDGTKFLYVTEIAEDGGVSKQLRLAAADGSWRKTVEIGDLSHNWRRELAPVWSPDGSKLLLSLTEGPYSETCVLRGFLPDTVGKN